MRFLITAVHVTTVAPKFARPDDRGRVENWENFFTVFQKATDWKDGCKKLTSSHFSDSYLHQLRSAGCRARRSSMIYQISIGRE